MTRIVSILNQKFTGHMKLKTGLLSCLLSISIWHTSVSVAAPANRGYPDSVIEQIDFRDVTVGDALKVLSDQSSLNIIASRDAANIPVTMFLRRVTAMEVLEALAKTYNLWYQRDADSNIVRIYTVKEYRLEQVEFKKEETEIFTLKNTKNALDLAESIQTLFSGRVLLSYGANEYELMTDLSQRFQRFNMIDGRSTLSGRGGGGSGNGNNNGQNGGNFGGGGNNGRGGANQNINAGRGGINGNRVGVNAGGQSGNTNREIELDEQLRASTQMLKSLLDEKKGAAGGIVTGDVDAGGFSNLLDTASRRQAPIFVGVIKHQNRVLVRTRDQDAMSEIKRLFKKLDTESSMLLMEVKVLSIDLSDGYNSLFDFKLKTNNLNAAQNRATQTIGAEQVLDSTLRAAATAFDPALLATVVSNNFEARLQLLEKEGRVTELATPMLMTSNQEVSRVFVGEERPIISGYKASSTINTSAAVAGTVLSTPILEPQTEVRAIGTTLLLTPNINADRTVGVQLLVEQSNLSAAKGIIPVQIGNTLQDALIDLVQERTFSGTVVAKDDTAVAVGGLIEEAASNQENKVPLLGDIPGLGFFFREDAQSRARRELVIIIKPHILETPNEAQAESQKMLKENSIHPEAQQPDSLNIYSNNDQRHKGYVLEQPYKQYSKQDSMDRARGKGQLNQPAPVAAVAPASPESLPSNQQVYVDLTRYASEAIRINGTERKYDPKISSVPIRQFQQVDLSYDARITAMPIASWKQGGVYVTALELHNVSANKLTVDYRHLKGQWLASTIEEETLDKRGSENDATYLYLISAQPFEDNMAQANR